MSTESYENWLTCELCLIKDSQSYLYPSLEEWMKHLILEHSLKEIQFLKRLLETELETNGQINYHTIRKFVNDGVL